MDHAAILIELAKAGLITPEDQTRAIRAAQINPDHPNPLYHARALGVISEQDLVAVLANSSNVQGWRLDDFAPPPDLVDRLGVPNMRRMSVVPLREETDGSRDMVLVGMVNPGEQEDIDTLRLLLGGVLIRPCVVSPYDLDRLLSGYGSANASRDDRASIQSLDALLATMSSTEAVMEDPDGTAANQALDAEVDSSPVVAVVDGLIARAVGERASDIHIEPMTAGVQIRFRVDGALHIVVRMPAMYAKALSTVIKNKAKMDMTDRMRPQDGRIRAQVQNRKIDLRVSSIPGRHGEKIVIRILDHASVQPEISALGMEPPEYERLLSALVSPHGLILVTGPTGSGKTTTLYAILNYLNRSDVNIVTVEDPVEYEMPGITQVATNDKANITFAEVLKAFLRQDPDIIMVGEIRDNETAQTAMRAALTGHLVLSTIHTNDASEALTRLIDLDVERANLAGSARLMIAQRLLRRLCVRCREQVEPDESTLAPLLRDQVRAVERAPEGSAEEEEERAELDMMREWFHQNRAHFFARNASGGCTECSKTGYRGRIGIYEMIEVTEEIQKLIVSGGSAAEIRTTAQSQGTRTLRQVALMHAAHGTTSLQEVIENTI